MVPVRPASPALAGPRNLQIQVVPQKYDVQAGIRSLFVGLAFAAIAGYHGYQRNSSLLWAAVWATGGFICPVVTLPIAIHQGFANRKG